MNLNYKYFKSALYLLTSIVNLVKRFKAKTDRQGWSVTVNIIKERLSSRYQIYINSNKLKKALREKNYDVLYIVGDSYGEPKRYRVYNCIEVLASLKLRAIAIPLQQLTLITKYNLSYKVLILFRTPYQQAVNNLVNLARLSHIPIIYDIDDLIFETESLTYVDRGNLLSDIEKKHYIAFVESYKKMLLLSDYVTCSTNFLAKRVERLGKSAYVIPNTINKAQIDLADKLLVSRDNKHYKATIKIGYFSGTRSHQRDFLECENSLLAILEKYTNCHFVLVGMLQLGPFWDKFKHRVECIPFQPYLKMLEILADIDINLAPLELNNPFCDSKSQLKIFEAGLVKVPTIASPTSSYQEAIMQGVDGFLAARQEDWYGALDNLVNSSTLRRKIGEAARVRALVQFSPDSIRDVLCEIYGLK